MKCPKCGAEMVRTPDKILTSEPPMYEYVCPKCGAINYKRTDEIDTDNCEHGVLIALPDPWQDFRCVAAKDFLAAMLTNGSTPFPHNDAQVKRAIDYADELIKQLKERDEHNNSK